MSLSSAFESAMACREVRRKALLGRILEDANCSCDRLMYRLSVQAHAMATSLAVRGVQGLENHTLDAFTRFVFRFPYTP